MVMTDGVYRLITDHLGSVRLVVNAETGAVVQRMDYDAFGRVLNDTNDGLSIVTSNALSGSRPWRHNI